MERLFEELSERQPSIFARLAVMHAVLRATGAEYRNTNGNNADRGRSDPFAQAVSDGETISFNYILDINKLWVFSPALREAWIVASLAGPRYTRPPGPLYPREVGGLGFIVHPPDPKGWPFGYQVRQDGSCPPIPASDLADRYSHPQAEVPNGDH